MLERGDPNDPIVTPSARYRL